MADLLPDSKREYRFTVADIIQSMHRELDYRVRVFDRRVSDRKMTRAEADRQIALTHAWIAMAQTFPLDRVFTVPAP